MTLLSTIETRIARIVEGTFGKVFRSSVQPVELARRLVKEMDEHQQRTVRNVYVPNRYDVYLSREDHRLMSPYASALTTELGEYLAEHARRNAYALLTRPRVQLHLDRDLGLGRFGIAVKMEQPGDADEPAAVGDALAAPPADAVEAASPMPGTPSPAAAVASSDTLVQDAIVPQVAPASPAGDMAVFGAPGGTVPLDGSRVRVGRGRSNEIVLSDSSVSREHGEFLRDGAGGWKVRDLDSTNGVAVNGSRITERSLEAGDSVAFGNAVLRFDLAPGGR